MILSQTARYALRALVYLAEEARTEPVTVDQAAEALQLPRNYLSKILHGLVRSGFLTSLRGPRGGFQLARPPEEIPLLDIVKEFDGVGWQAACLLGSRSCSASDPCAAHEGWAKVKAQVGEFLGETSIRDLANTPSMLE